MKKKHRRNTLKNMLLTVLSVLSLGLASISGAQTLHRGIGGEPGTLDPNLVSGNWEDMVVGDLFLGLVTDAADGRVIPGAATDWTVSDDGTVYTFHLRKDGKWSDGQPVTAHDFVFSLRRVMDPQTASTYAYILYPIKNAEAINTGKIRDLSQLGVRAIDDYTLEITLESSTPYFLELLTHYTAFPIPKHVVERYGKDWVKPGHLVSNGAYKLVEWLPQTHIKAVKNEWFYDADHVAIDTVFYYPTEDRSAALKRFRAGELDLNYEFPIDQYDWLRENMPEETVVSPQLGVYYYPLNLRNPKFQDVRVRKALSMAINREVITDKILKTGEVPAYSFVPPGIGDYRIQELDFKGMPYNKRLEDARKLMEAAGYSEDRPLELVLRYNTHDAHKKVAVAVAAMWKAIHVKTQLLNSEVAVHYAELKEANFEVARAGWVGDYADPQNFLSLLEPTPNNYGGYNNAQFNALMKQAAETQDSTQRTRLMEQAERIAMDDYATIPIYYYVATNLVSQKVKGWVPNVLDKHRTRWMSIER
ncbi:peptide ABC transporter substrate-binding protein [Marinobacter lutaoensis]|jgi:oligopeptide transport system substrate-binding protein|nr:peptide ABC transporter substrate-binding protein [Marinobacter lutaoensis]